MDDVEIEKLNWGCDSPNANMSSYSRNGMPDIP